MATAFKDSSFYTHTELRGFHSYVLPELKRLCASLKPGARVLDVGCGNGSVAKQLSDLGFHITGIDMSQSGVQMARINCPQGRFELLPADHDVLKNLDEPPFDLVYSLEVIEHLYDPTSFLDGCFAATSPGGTFICSTPYHGYLKNIALSLTNSWDTHANPLNDGGHIRFYSKKTLAKSLVNSGFENPTMMGSGRLPYLWKSLIAVTHKPA